MSQEKKRLINFLNSGVSQENQKEEFDPDINYNLNIKCVSKLKPASRNRIRYKTKSIYFESENDPYIEYVSEYVEIFVYEERSKIIRQLMVIIQTRDIPNIFLHGNAGFGKSHILIDLVARLRLRFMDNPIKKPKFIIFYFMFNITDSDQNYFIEELYFSCYPIINHEKILLGQDLKNFEDGQLTEIEKYFEELIMINKSSEDFWEISKKIINYIIKKYNVQFLVIFDQINEISKEYEDEDTGLPQFLQDEVLKKIYSTFNHAEISKIICASNNNKTMRNVLVEKSEEVHIKARQ